MYIISGVVGFIIYLNLPFEYYWNLLLADMASTVVIFIFSLIFKNASCYDAYWSVAPIVIVFGYLFTTPFNAVRILLSISVLLWGLRLTLNWVYTFDNLKWIDWRYQKLKNQTKLFYPIVNLGIIKHLERKALTNIRLKLECYFQFIKEVKKNMKINVPL